MNLNSSSQVFQLPSPSQPDLYDVHIDSTMDKEVDASKQKFQGMFSPSSQVLNESIAGLPFNSATRDIDRNAQILKSNELKKILKNTKSVMHKRKNKITRGHEVIESGSRSVVAAKFHDLILADQSPHHQE